MDWTSEPVGSDGETDFIVVMPPASRLGEQQLKLIGSTTDEQAPTAAFAPNVRPGSTPSPRRSRLIPSTWRSLQPMLREHPRS